MEAAIERHQRSREVGGGLRQKLVAMRKFRHDVAIAEGREAKGLFEPGRGSVLVSACLLVVSVACATRARPGTFQVLPVEPVYILRSPDSEDTPFPEVLWRADYAGPGWVQLLPRMRVRIESPYYRDSVSERTLQNYLGTEVARYQVRPAGGLQLHSVESGLTQRPNDERSVEQLIRASQRRHRYYRLLFQVAFQQKGSATSAILLGAESMDRLDRLTDEVLSEPQSVCNVESANCTVFPEFCTVSPEFEVRVNGSTHAVLWGSTLRDVVENSRHVQLLRLHQGRSIPVEMDSSDPEALRLPLLPGDWIRWR